MIRAPRPPAAFGFRAPVLRSISTAVLLVGLLSAGKTAAAVSVGAELGIAEATDRNREMRQYGVVAALDLPWHRPLGRNWLAWTQVTGRAGHMTGWGDDGSYGALGFRMNLTAVKAGVSLESSAGPMTLSRIHFGGADFGGHVQLLAQFGFSYQITRTLALGYRFQHMSNGGTERSNPGLDSHLFRIEARLGSRR
jgi:hypothetical protein